MVKYELDEEFLNRFWNEKVKIADDPSVARIGGEHYIIGDENDPSHFRGFDGDLFKIRFFRGPNAGKTITTTNLWHQGKIPDNFRDVLFDNAEFVRW
jgi:hypothetical protein